MLVKLKLLLLIPDHLKSGWRRETWFSRSAMFLNLRPQPGKGQSLVSSGISFTSALSKSLSAVISTSSSSVATSYSQINNNNLALTMIPSRSSPKLLVSSSNRSTSESDQYLPAFGTFCRLCRAFAATLAISISSRFESFNTSTSLSRMFVSAYPSSFVAVLSPFP